MVPTALKWSDGVKLMVTTHFDLISGPLRVPRGPKGVILAQSLNFHVPIFWEILFVSNIGLWGVQSVAAECLAHSALFLPIWNHPARENRQKGFIWAPKGPIWAPKGPIWGLLMSSVSPGGQIWSQLHLIGLPGLDSWSPHSLTWYRALSTFQFYRVA